MAWECAAVSVSQFDFVTRPRGGQITLRCTGDVMQYIGFLEVIELFLKHHSAIIPMLIQSYIATTWTHLWGVTQSQIYLKDTFYVRPLDRQYHDTFGSCRWNDKKENLSVLITIGNTHETIVDSDTNILARAACRVKYGLPKFQISNVEKNTKNRACGVASRKVEKLHLYVYICKLSYFKNKTKRLCFQLISSSENNPLY